MFKSICPKCNHKFWNAKQRIGKTNKWYHLNKINIHCPSCGALLIFSKKSKKWNSALKFIVVPFWLIISIGVWPENTLLLVKLSSLIITFILFVLFVKYHEYETENNEKT